ncbi:MAG TPA: HIT domain-containing protein [Actinomycetota bacterium]|nr:HIT domain-containing protein [Actinomycetota bacterium]
MQYVSASGGDDGCIFCDHLAAGEEVLFRGPTTFVLLNAFPYNTGHLMVAPHRHVGELGDLSEQERHELMDVSAEAVRIVREAMAAHGFNVGMNLGNVAGAGIPGHLHVHVVPRWGGDTNFMTTVGETKVLPELLADTAAKLRPGFARLDLG